MIQFNETAHNVADYLQADHERIDNIKAKFDGQPVLASIKAIITSDELQLGEKFALIFDIGSTVGQQKLYSQMQAQQLEKITEGQPIL